MPVSLVQYNTNIPQDYLETASKYNSEILSLAFRTEVLLILKYDLSETFFKKLATIFIVNVKITLKYIGLI